MFGRIFEVVLKDIYDYPEEYSLGPNNPHLDALIVSGEKIPNSF